MIAMSLRSKLAVTVIDDSDIITTHAYNSAHIGMLMRYQVFQHAWA